MATPGCRVKSWPKGRRLLVHTRLRECEESWTAVWGKAEGPRWGAVAPPANENAAHKL